MAHFPRRLAPDLIAGLAGGPGSARLGRAPQELRPAARALRALAGTLLVGLAPGAACAELDLEGSWHVLVHYRDASAANAETDRWEDRLWVFEPAGDRLRWKEYPIVVFDDETGRFERRAGSGQYARVLHRWEPSPEQLANLRAGLAANDRGSQSKSLRRRGDAWSSESRANATGASVVTYQESWSIEDPDGLPVFEQVDVLGSESAESAEGRTVLRTEQLLEDGALLVGSYDRDGTRRGTFQMRRSGERRELAKKTQSQLQAQAVARAIQSSSEVRRQILDFAREELADAGIFLNDAEVDSLVAQATELSMKGSNPEEIRDRLRVAVREKWISFAPPGAVHDDAVRYRFPFDASVARKLDVGVGGDMATGVPGPTSDMSGHLGWSRYSFDFELPRDAKVLAAREGEVARIGTQFTEMSEREGRSTPSAMVVVLHADGTYGIYGHLAEVAVETGARVVAGQELGVARGPRIHFGVARNLAGKPESLEIRFDDGTPEGVLPVSGLAYGGKRP